MNNAIKTIFHLNNAAGRLNEMNEMFESMESTRANIADLHNLATGPIESKMEGGFQ